MSTVASTPADAIRPSSLGSTSLIYALGSISHDFGSEARRDSIAENMEGNPGDPRALLKYLESNPWDSASIIWTLDLDSVPIYALVPDGPYASETYARMRRFLHEQITEGVERVSIPAYATSGSAMLLSGLTIPIIEPEIRGMASWTKKALVEAVVGAKPGKSAPEADQEAFEAQVSGVGNFLDRVYFELRNLGMTSEERAINYSATNAFNVERAFESALKDNMELDSIEVERSPICRPDSDCWDVKLVFFFPLREVQPVRKVFRFTVDVSDVVPVMVGGMRVWTIR